MEKPKLKTRLAFPVAPDGPYSNKHGRYDTEFGSHTKVFSAYKIHMQEEKVLEGSRVNRQQRLPAQLWW